MAYTYKKRVNTNSKHSANYPTTTFSKNSRTGGNCTWWAWERFREVYENATGKHLSWTAGAGNAYRFYDIMGKAGYKTGLNPKPGAIICWGYHNSYNGDPGHVAFVEEVFNNGDIEISQSGWSSGPMANRKLSRGPGTQGTKSYQTGYSNSYFKGFIYNKVEFTNPNGTVSGFKGTATSDHPKSWYINKYGNEAKVYFALRDESLSHKASCAIMGNMKQESGFNPTVVNSIGATGLCQWYKGRCTKMKSYNSGESSWKTIRHQIKYLMHELKTGYKDKVYSVLKNDNKSLKDMTYAFLRWFEIPGNYDTEINRRYPNAQTYDKRYKNATSGGAPGDDLAGVQAVVDMQQRSSQLYSSAGFDWKTVKSEKYESESTKTAIDNTKAMRAYFASLSSIQNPSSNQTFAIPDYINIKINHKSKEITRKSSNILPIASAMVEAPFVEANINGTIVGTVKNSVDDFPNHISSLEVQKVNGEINKYSLNIVHQIRPGEDPNLFDKILSNVRYNEIKIRYGDFASNTIYGDEKVFITDIVMNRDYVGNKITYTIHGTSAGVLVTSYKLNFLSRTDKPSNIINDLLYKNKSTSNILLQAFPGMKNKSLVASKNLIPSTDCVLQVDDQINRSPIEYINYLVSCMSNSSNSKSSVIRNSSYYITYENDHNGKMGGAYFKITEVKKDTIPSSYGNNIYEITVGYPDNNFVMGFNVSNDSAWSLLYKNANIASEYIYSYDSEGKKVKEYSPNLMSSSNPFNEIQKNWWTYMTQFPINATVTLKGLMKPVMLMDYIIVNVVFYGQKHITSGVYTLTGQTDILSGDGFRTNLSLTRIGAI